MSQMIATGKKAPGFSLPDHLGRTITLEQFAGKRKGRRTRLNQGRVWLRGCGIR